MTANPIYLDRDAMVQRPNKGAPIAVTDFQTEHPLLTIPEFMATFTNPDYIVDGIIQRGRVHSLTAKTGHGKTAVALYLGCSVAMGRDIGNIEIAQGNVIFLAGENPDDFCGRVHAACQFYNIDPAKFPALVMPGNFSMDADAAQELKRQIDATGCKPAMIIGDSAAAYFPGDDDNQNVQMGGYARTLRILTGCKGNPAVIILCHPVKNPSKDNLLPRGGGAFLNEVDAGLTLWADTQEITQLHWSGKIRGADFQPVDFALKQVALADKKDRKGRSFMSVVATLQTDEQADNAVVAKTTDENTVLGWLHHEPGISLGNLAYRAHWLTGPDNKPNKSRVQRLLEALAQDKLVRKFRNKWEITPLGRAEIHAD